MILVNTLIGYKYIHIGCILIGILLSKYPIITIGHIISLGYQWGYYDSIWWGYTILIGNNDILIGYIIIGTSNLQWGKPKNKPSQWPSQWVNLPNNMLLIVITIVTMTISLLTQYWLLTMGCIDYYYWPHINPLLIATY